MGGRVWSVEEERVFWGFIVPHSQGRVGIDKTLHAEKSWLQLVPRMKELVHNNARREYTALSLYEHYFQNVMIRRVSPNARSHVARHLQRAEEAGEPIPILEHRPRRGCRAIANANTNAIADARVNATTEANVDTTATANVNAVAYENFNEIASANLIGNTDTQPNLVADTNANPSVISNPIANTIFAAPRATIPAAVSSASSLNAPTMFDFPYGPAPVRQLFGTDNPYPDVGHANPTAESQGGFITAYGFMQPPHPS